MNFQQLIMLGLQASIFLTVFGYGLQATTDDVLYVVRRPAVLARSLVAMFLIMPLIGVIITAAFEFHPAVEIALVAIAISPIPPLLPQRAIKAGGGASYALGLMATAALLSIVFIPVAVHFIGRLFNEPFTMPLGAAARLPLLTVVVPLAAGMAFRAGASTIADRIQKPVAVIALVLLGLSVLAILIAALPAVIALVGNGTIVVIVAFVMAGLAVGHLLGGEERNEQIVLAISTACRHPAIALAIANAIYPQEKLVIGAIVLYLVLNIVVSIPYVKWQR
jgi:bile acid:Na+ symporter, BASS family